MTAYDPAWLDRMYNNRALVPEHGEHFVRWDQASAQVRATEPCVLDLAYGEAPGERLDVFPAQGAGKGRRAPVLVFIHGGWWRSLDKADHSFVASAFARQGVCVVVPNYTLCPAATIPGIALEMVRALAWTWRHAAAHGGDPDRITVAGHSAGGHLAALLLTCDWPRWSGELPADLVKGAFAISGLYELDPIRHTPFLAESLRLTAEQVDRASPVRLPAPATGRLYTVAGADESPEFLRQNTLMQKAWGTKRVPVCEAHLHLNHFTVLDALADPGHRMHQLALQLLRG